MRTHTVSMNETMCFSSWTIFDIHGLISHESLNSEAGTVATVLNTVRESYQTEDPVPLIFCLHLNATYCTLWELSECGPRASESDSLLWIPLSQRLKLKRVMGEARQRLKEWEMPRLPRYVCWRFRRSLIGLKVCSSAVRPLKRSPG